MIEYKRNDEQFNLDTISNQDLFDGLKGGMEDSAKTLKHFADAEQIDIQLDDDHCVRKQAYGSDGNLYPNIHLSTTISNPAEIYSAVNAIFIVSPFGGKMVVFGEGIQMQSQEPDELQKAIQSYIQQTFPSSDYSEKLKKYETATRIKNKVYDEMVFGK